MFTGGASNMAEGVDRTFILIFSIALVFIIGITAFMIYTVIRFSRKKGKPAMQFSGSTTLEVIWTVIPLALVMVMFYYGWTGFARMRNVPEDAMPVKVTGRMWEWEFDYGNGLKSKNLVVPVNKPVRLNLHSEDVNHGLFIPAFRVKEDVIPGYDNYLWFIPTIEGEYEILCSSYCGLLHSGMLSKAIVVNQDSYEKWISGLKVETEKPLPEGFRLLQSTGCLACHSTDGKNLVGPTFKGLFGSERNVMEGNKVIKVVADENYIKRSVYEPDAQVVSGFNKGIMKSYKGILSENDMSVITGYFKTLNEGK
jgi:cytochrome c oxidase subunit II